MFDARREGGVGCNWTGMSVFLCGVGVVCCRATVLRWGVLVAVEVYVVLVRGVMCPLVFQGSCYR